ncbi:MAG: FAD-dependent monooxygenase, partial [Rhodobacteraceae bacterium]|nr:FAD-dependent monooxygenase [Paracoccaceae bacterium]
VEFELDWVSIYTFQCRRMEQFRHERVIFAGDAAHQVSPFGARGANSGLQDTDNLCWKLKLVIDGDAPETLLDSYNAERVWGADENILNSSRSTDFITPKSGMSRVLRDAVLDLSEQFEFARPLVNSGRLSVPCTYDGSPLNSADALNGPERSRPGSPCPDAPLGDGFLLPKLAGKFTLLTIDADAPDVILEDGITVTRLALSVKDDATLALKNRYLGEATSGVYLIRPDQHVAARRPSYDDKLFRAAIRRATGKE